MCDTIGKIINESYAIFGKNSDRAVNEPQVVEFYPAKDYLEKSKVKCTYIEIDQVKHTNAIVLSRPTWLWGGEIGVNEYGVCIGNEAVFTKGKYGKDSLIGMDLLRLGLERAESAKGALDVIVDLLQKYGQGGNCGFDTSFHYNNSFLIMDRKEMYVLETVGKDYVYKKQTHTSISNCLCIGDDGDFYKEGKCDFKSKYSDFIMTTGACGKKRRLLSGSQQLNNVNDMIKILSSHQENSEPFIKGSVASVCMHAANTLTVDQTTMSMIVELKNDSILIWITGCSLPCVSLYKPFNFEQFGLIFENKKSNDSYWHEHESFNRKLLSSIVPQEYYKERQNAQNQINYLALNGVDRLTSQKALEIEKEFFNKWKEKEYNKKRSSILFNSFWRSKNKAL